MKKQKLKFGCPKCGYLPEEDKKQSSKNWKVYKNEPCPKCKTQMKLLFN
jgi:Zn finger protein HypA/HybF involved in hydrogenase expression